MTRAMPVDSRVATIRLSGGHPVLDLANTVSWRLDPQQRHDHLQTHADLVTWAVRAGVVSQAESEQLSAARGTRSSRRQALERVLGLREAVHGVLADPPGQLRQQQAVSAAYEAAVRASRLRPGQAAWEWVDRRPSPLTPVHRLALAAVDLLTSGDAAAVKQCADDACGWLFLDRSRQHNRRWCSSADCGNRNRVRLHYQRHRDETVS